MTNEGILNIIQILRGNYPTENWKLSGKPVQDFAGALKKYLAKYTDEEVFDALDDAMNESHNALPSVVMIKAAVKRRRNATPDYQALPAPPINEKGRARIKALIALTQENIKSRKPGRRSPNWHWPPSASEHEIQEISRFARHLFPDMEDKQIAENFDVFREQYRMRGHLDGHRTILRLDKYTGLVEQVVQMHYTVRK